MLSVRWVPRVSPPCVSYVRACIGERDGEPAYHSVHGLESLVDPTVCRRRRLANGHQRHQTHRLERYRQPNPGNFTLYQVLLLEKYTRVWMV